jgi:hypothetical protein
LAVGFVHVFFFEPLDFKFPKFPFVKAILAHRQLVIWMELVSDLCY